VGSSVRELGEAGTKGRVAGAETDDDVDDQGESMTTRKHTTALPVAAGVLTGTVALYIALVAFGNITDFDTNRDFVRHVLSMDTTFKDQDLMWRAVTSHSAQDAAYMAIIAWETVAAVVLFAGAGLWLTGLRGRRTVAARRVSTAGLLMLLVLFGAGFLAIGGEWFAMWQSKDWNGLDAATRNFTVAGLVLLIVHLPGGAGRGGEGDGE
jgi:predicted small integral membrane protein